MKDGFLWWLPSAVHCFCHPVRPITTMNTLDVCMYVSAGQSSAPVSPSQHPRQSSSDRPQLPGYETAIQRLKEQRRHTAQHPRVHSLDSTPTEWCNWCYCNRGSLLAGPQNSEHLYYWCVLSVCPSVCVSQVNISKTNRESYCYYYYYGSYCSWINVWVAGKTMRHAEAQSRQSISGTV